VRAWVVAPLEVAVARLRERPADRVPVAEPEARRIWHAAVAAATGRRFDVELNTSAPLHDERVAGTFAAALRARGWPAP
jgi:hypothetical protein